MAPRPRPRQRAPGRPAAPGAHGAIFPCYHSDFSASSPGIRVRRRCLAQSLIRLLWQWPPGLRVRRSVSPPPGPPPRAGAAAGSADDRDSEARAGAAAAAPTYAPLSARLFCGAFAFGCGRQKPATQLVTMTRDIGGPALPVFAGRQGIGRCFVKRNNCIFLQTRANHRANEGFYSYHFDCVCICLDPDHMGTGCR